MDELQKLMGDSYKEGLTVEDITNFMKGKNFADLSQGGYVSSEKYNREIGDYKKQIADKDKELNGKLTDDELVKKEAKQKDDRIAELEKLLSANTITTNKSMATSALAEALSMVDLKSDDNEFTNFINNISTEDAEKTTTVAKYVNELIKKAYDKGKKDSTRDALGGFGKQKGGSDSKEDEVGALGKELAQASSNNKVNFDYFKQN